VSDDVNGDAAGIGTPIVEVAGRPARVSTHPGWRMVDRRGLLRLLGTAAVAAPAGSLLAACGTSGSGSTTVRTVRIGYISPQTGALSGFSDVDSYIVDTMRQIFASGIQVGKRTYPVEIIVRDSQSDHTRAARATSDLIYKDKVDLVLVGSTADTVNPVSNQCEANQVPCISTAVPWQSWFYGRGGRQDAPFTWTYHFYWGLAEATQTHIAMWGQLATNRKVGVLWPDDTDGRAFADDSYGFPRAIGNAGYVLVDPGRYTDGTSDFSRFIDFFRDHDVQIVTGIPTFADFWTFWRQSPDHGYKPKIVTVSKALLFASDVEILGSTGHGLATEVAWSPSHPYHSFLTNKDGQSLAKDYADRTGKPWVQNLGFAYALFEVAAQALQNVDSIENRRGIADAIAALHARTIVGNFAFGSRGGVPKNVATTTLVGGQWVHQPGEEKFTLKIVNNAGDVRIAPESTLQVLQQQ
jgi:branched-chain amino acid transport system substrate-binding protein